MACSLLAALLLLAGCSSQSPETSAKGGGTSTLAVAAEDLGSSLDPALDFNGWTMHRHGVVDTLVDVTDKLAPEPELATAWKATDPTTWTFTLRDGVTFQNGQKLDAAAVKAALEHTIKVNVRAKNELKPASISVDGDKTVIIKTTEPNGAVPQVLADPAFAIQVIGGGVDQDRAPVTTGPFKVVSFTEKQGFELDAYPRYWRGAPQLNHVSVRFYADSQAASMALQSGEVQVAVRPPAAGLKVFENNSRYTIRHVTSTRSDGIIFNTQSPTTKDLKVRQAINAALDRDAYPGLMHGMGEKASTFFPDNVAYGGESGLEVPAKSKDLAKAKALLQEAGYAEQNGQMVKDGTPLTLRVVTYTTRPQLGRMAQLLQSDLKTLGVKVDIREVKSSSEIMKAGDFDLGMYSLVVTPTGDPAYFFGTFLGQGSESNFSRWSDERFSKALNALVQNSDPSQLPALTKAAEQIVLDQVPFVVFGHQQWWYVAASNVQGLDARPTEFHMLNQNTRVS